MTSSNYQTNSVDLDSTYIVGNDPNYQGIQAAVTNRKTVVFGQQLLTQTYPIGNLNNAINYVQSLPVTLVDQDSTTITGVGPTAVFYNNRANAQSLIRGSFNLLENYPQTTDWQIGLTNRSSPVQIGTSSNWTAVSTGLYNTGAIQNPTNSNLWMWGSNTLGQLGQSNTTNRSSPVQVNGILWGWSQLAIGQGVSLTLLSNGSLWTWGGNSYGQLGVGSAGANILSPVQIGTLSTWTRISANNYFAFAVKNDGTLWSWGSNSFGQLGINTSTFSAVLSPVQSGTLSAWSQVACGYNFTTAIQSNGTLWSWGNNSFGQLGVGSVGAIIVSPVQIGALSVWTRISAGAGFMSAIQSNGTLWAWGRNNLGQLGLSDVANRSSPVQVGTLSGWTQVSCGYFNTAAIQSNGTLYLWGSNQFGQLGNNSTASFSSPVQVDAPSTWTRVACGYNFTAAIQSPGTLWSWGRNQFGQLGLTPSGIPVNKQVYGL